MLRIAEILTFLDEEGVAYSFCGDKEVQVEGFSSLTCYKPGSFTWVKKQTNIPEGFDTSAITLAIVSEDITGNFQNIISTSRSKFAFFSTIEKFFDMQPSSYVEPIGQFTYLSPNVKLGKNVRIGHNCVLDGDITIGDNTIIWHNVTIINRVIIGRNCEIQSGTRIGHDGFGYTEDEYHHKTMIKHYGGVEIGNDVYIGDNVVVNRGAIDNTVIGEGVKIDSLSKIAHNVIIGLDSALAYPCNIGGSAHLGENVYISAATIRNQLTVGDNAFVGMGAVVAKDVAANTIVVGNPAKPLIK